MASNLPEITLEINSGSLTIRTAEAIYHVLVVGECAQGAHSQPAIPMKPAAPRPMLAHLDEPPRELDGHIENATGAPEDEEYYRELSQDMYKEVGRLARRLSMSIRDVTIDKMDGIDLNSAGDQLESAKDELENVVKMTEQATLKIMDLTEGIQNSVDKTKKIMQQMNVDAAETAPATEEGTGAAAGSSAWDAFLLSLAQNPLADSLAKAQELIQALQSAPQESAAPALTGPAYDFPLDLVFQTMYELCTNEAVKKHVKAMWDTAEQTFDSAKLEVALNQVAAAGGGPDEDNFLNLSLKEVLKAMFQSTAKENFQQILKKMASTADQIFLEPSLPLEAIPKAHDPALAEASAADPAGDNPALALATGLLSELQAKAAALDPSSLPPLSQAAAGTSGRASVSPELIKQLHDSMGEIFSYVNGIVEALSFQDLSGQTIYKTVKMLTDFQVQILALLVGFGSKLKNKEEAPSGVDTAKSDAMAQEEVDKALASVGATEADEASGVGKLNQDSVNNLLDSLGF